MLIDFSFSNFRSFRDAQQFSMQRLNKETSRDKTLWPNHPEISTVSALYGANAAGKTSFLKAIRFVSDFVANSFRDSGKTDTTGRQAFRLDETSSDNLSEFLIEFYGTDGNKYRYEFSLDDENVYREELRVFLSVRSSLLFLRQLDNGKTSVQFGHLVKGLQTVFYEKSLRKNVLLLSMLASSTSELTQPAFESLATRIVYCEAVGFRHEIRKLEQNLGRENTKAEDLSALMANVGVGIRAISLDTSVSDEISAVLNDPENPKYGRIREQFLAGITMSMPEATKDERDQALQKACERFASNNDKPGELLFQHTASNNRLVAFRKEDESRGTVSALAFLSLALFTLSHQTTLLMDEIDTSLHPLLVEELVKLYQDPLTNPHHSQIIFTTHDTSLIYSTGAVENVVGRDQIWFTEKNEDGASTLYPGSQFGIRFKNENIARNYLNGVYGALPKQNFHREFANILTKELKDDEASEDSNNGICATKGE